MRSKWLLVSLFSALILISAGAFFLYQNHSNYQLVSVRRSSVKEAIYGIGTVQARHSFSFKVGLTRTIEKVFVREGDNVKKGDNLIKLSDSPMVKSPLQGTVVSLPFHDGENVFADQPVISIQDLKDRYVTASLEQQGALRVKIGMKANLSFESLRQDTFTGKVQSVFPKNGIFIAQIEVDHLPDVIIPGMTADVGIEVAEKQNALLVPSRALSAGMVTVVREGKKKKVAIKTGVMDHEWVEIVSGDIHDSDQIIVPNNR